MKKEGLSRVPFQEKPRCFFETAAGIEEEVVFVRELDADAEVVFGMEEADDFFGVMVDVDDELGDTERFEAIDGDFKESAAVHFDEGFGDGVGQRAKAGAETRREDHGFHRLAQRTTERSKRDFSFREPTDSSE